MVAFSSAILLSVFMLPLSSSRLMNLFRCLDKYLCRFPYRQYSAISKSSSAKSKRIVSRWTSQMNKTSHYTDTGTSALSIALLKKIVQVFVCRLCLLFFLNYGVLTRSFVIFLQADGTFSTKSRLIFTVSCLAGNTVTDDLQHKTVHFRSMMSTLSSFTVRI